MRYSQNQNFLVYLNLTKISQSTKQPTNPPTNLEFTPDKSKTFILMKFSLPDMA